MFARELQINGIVQGVGFRPFVAKLARSLSCTGWVRNSARGVEILVQSEDANALDDFERRLVEDAPVASRIIALDAREVPAQRLDSFEIVASAHDDSKSTLVSPDLATCDDCVAELFDPRNRRYRYPFINCTNCGPRFTIIDDLPYDRRSTSMRDFEMCQACAAEYADENDRRYHAQPDACFDCGPRLWLVDAADIEDQELDGNALVVDKPFLAREESDGVIREAAARIARGEIVAIKSLGGWHLACDATNEKTVRRLRERKHRPTKPLAVMVRDVEAARKLASVSEDEAEALLGPARPIVLLERKSEDHIAPSVVDPLNEIGIMLPATPLQHLLMDELSVPLVMTSGNRSGEPIVATDRDAFEALSSIADAFLGNNRAIVARYDDSVLRIENGELQMIRRARGFAPAPLFVQGRAEGSEPVIFAAGPEQKSTFALLKGDRMYLSQHLGDLEHLGAMRAWEEARERYEELFDVEPQVIVCDMHPEYLASKWARSHAAERDIPLVEVQHHHAHIASVMGENDLHDPVIGVALDGTGYGSDGTIWGGEILIATRKDFERFWHLPSFTLPGGASAIMNPKRTAYAVLKAYSGIDDPFFGQLSLDKPQFADFLEELENRELLDQMIEKNLNAPATTSAGRLFDAASALLGACAHPSYDGEAACLLEVAAQDEGNDTRPLTARTFHEGLINAIIDQVQRAREETGITQVALGGGCMMNRILRTQLRDRLRDLGFDVFLNRELPSNDGCIAYGQAIVARSLLEE